MIPDGDRRRRLHALVFTAVYSRYCFVYLSFSQTTQAVIAGCEAAWAFYGGIFPVLGPANLNPAGDNVDPAGPGWQRGGVEELPRPRPAPPPPPPPPPPPLRRVAS